MSWQKLKSKYAAKRKEPVSEGMKLVVGLGNPGPRYENTRHNVGFQVIDSLREQLSDDYTITPRSRFDAMIYEIRGSGGNALLVKPLNYMNRSGQSVVKIANWYKLDLDDIIVIQDDVDLPTGKVRFREKGGAGGHNGISSIINHLGTDQFKRAKIGIARPYSADVSGHVLTPFCKEEQKDIDIAVEQVSEGVSSWLKGEDFLMLMNKYN